MRAGQTSPSDFGQRMRGSGPRWQTVVDLFELHLRGLGFEHPAEDELGILERDRGRARQGTLFP